MSTDDRDETITDRAAIRDSDEPSERTTWQRLRAGRANAVCGCGCAELPTPAPVGASAGLDLDARADALLRAVETIKATGGAVEIAGVRIEPCDEFGSTVTTARAEAAEAERDALRAKVAAVEALAERLAASLALVLYDAHPVYGSTALWHGGIGGQAMTAHCAIIHGGPPGMEWTESYLPSMALHEFITATPGFNLDAAKADMLTDLRAALATGEGK